MNWTCITNGRGEKAYKNLVGKREGKRPLSGWKDDIKMDLKEVGRDCGLASSDSEYGSVTTFRVRCSASSASMKGRQFDYLSTC
jgi:hypothetical protein